MKKGRTSKAEQFYIAQNRAKSVADLAKDLDRSEDFVQKILAELPQDNKTSVVNTQSTQQIYGTQGFRKAIAGNRIKHPRNPTKTIGTVMSPGVSQMMDEQRLNNKGGQTQTEKDAIFHPFSEEDVKPR